MTVYVESSALLKLYLDEPESADAAEMLSGEHWTSGRHTLVEVRRNLARALDDDALEVARRRFASDWERIDVVEVDERTCALAANLAESTGLRSLDALHLGAAESLDVNIPLITFDRRLAGAARSRGWTVLPE
jgi:predicted nucleic acid-binding protein